MKTDEKICHVFIQWLASQKALDPFLEKVLEDALTGLFISLLKDNPSRILVDLFGWKSSSQGAMYWAALHSKWVELYYDDIEKLL